MAIQDFVVNSVNEKLSKEAIDTDSLKMGSLTIFSHSISIDPDSYEDMKGVADNIASKGPRYDKEISFEENDQRGYFQIEVEGKEIIVKHIYRAQEINEYRAKDPRAIKKQIAVDMAISDIDHAIYIGMELEKAYQSIKRGFNYKQG